MGDAERAMDAELFDRELMVRRAREAVQTMAGPAQCVKCGFPNDRAREGYAVCSCCMEEAALVDCAGPLIANPNNKNQ